jgi:hypothetical protein
MRTVTIQEALLHVTLPPEFKLYDVDGCILFPVYGSTGGLSTLEVAYIYRREYDINENRVKWMGACMSFSLADKTSAEGIGGFTPLAKQKLADSLKYLSEFDGNGGNMPPIRHTASKGAGE